MKVTLDTNVFVSAFIAKDGQPAVLLDLILTFPEIKLVLSRQILVELNNVLSRDEVKNQLGYSTKDIANIIGAVRDFSTLVEVRSKFKVVVEDPKDDIIINTAFDGNAEYIVSGDRHLQKLGQFRGMEMVNPRRMLKILRQRFGEFIISEGENQVG
jgi:putative PIN family toxin of toxin-antitoxin system